MSKNSISAYFFTFLLAERWGWRSPSLLREGEVNLTRASMSKNSISAHFYTFWYLRGGGGAPPCCVRVRGTWLEPWCLRITSQLTFSPFVTWYVRVTLLPAAWGRGELDSSLDVQELHLSSLLHLLLPERWGWRSSLLREGEVNLTRILMSKNSISAHFDTSFVTWEVRVTLLPAAWGWGEFDRQALASPSPPAASGRLLLAPS